MINLINPKDGLSTFFHSMTKDTSLGGKVVIPKDRRLWPKNWSEIEYKSYPYVNKIKLLPLEDCRIDACYSDLLESRKSSRDFSSSEEIQKSKFNLKSISMILQNSVGLSGRTQVDSVLKTELKFRNTPSAGARYPLEYYLLIENCLDIPPGLYHYNILENSLEEISPGSQISKNKRLFGYEFAEKASCKVFVTAVFNRTTRKYGE